MLGTFTCGLLWWVQTRGSPSFLNCLPSHCTQVPTTEGRIDSRGDRASPRTGCAEIPPHAAPGPRRPCLCALVGNWKSTGCEATGQGMESASLSLTETWPALSSLQQPICGAFGGSSFCFPSLCMHTWPSSQAPLHSAASSGLFPSSFSSTALAAFHFLEHTKVSSASQTWHLLFCLD